MKTFKITTVLFLFILTTLSAWSQNVMISNSFSPNEPSIKINPLNTDLIVAGANLNNYYYSSDSGQTWNLGTLTSSAFGVWGDPVIDVDPDGNFYFFHLSNPASGNWIDRIVCQKSIDNGQTWNDGTYTGLNGNKVQDKHWTVVDTNTGTIYMTWTQFDTYGSSSSSCKTKIMFSKSEDAGDTWSQAISINEFDGNCVDEDDTVEGAVPAIGANGEIFVAWAGPNGIVFNKSLDDGNTWLSQEIAVDPMPGGWDYSIPGIDRANGFPITKCDLSGGPNHGTIYVNWSDQRNGVSDTDVWLTKSTDSGETWSSPVRVNDDPAGKQQFFTWMDLDQTNGNLHFVFYDRRNYNDNNTDVYMAYSLDGGNSFVNYKVSESSFLPNAGVFFGDYTNITVHNNVVRPIWTRLQGGQLSLWTDVTPFDVLGIDDASTASVNEAIQFPNPATNISYVSFKLHELSSVSIKLYDTQGREVYTVLDNEQKDYGKYIYPINTSDLGLNSGTYFCKLSVNGKEKTLKMIVVK